MGVRLPARNMDPPEAGRERQERGFLEAAHLDFGLEASRTEKTNILLYWNSQLVVICYGGSRKQTHSHQSHVECPRALLSSFPDLNITVPATTPRIPVARPPERIPVFTSNRDAKQKHSTWNVPLGGLSVRASAVVPAIRLVGSSPGLATQQERQGWD